MFGAIYLHWSLKSPNSQYAYAKVHVIETVHIFINRITASMRYTTHVIEERCTVHNKRIIHGMRYGGKLVAEGVASPYLKITT
jgi:hypothetical protein